MEYWRTRPPWKYDHGPVNGPLDVEGTVGRLLNNALSALAEVVQVAAARDSDAAVQFVMEYLDNTDTAEEPDWQAFAYWSERRTAKCVEGVRSDQCDHSSTAGRCDVCGMERHDDITAMADWLIDELGYPHNLSTTVPPPWVLCRAVEDEWVRRSPGDPEDAVRAFTSDEGGWGNHRVTLDTPSRSRGISGTDTPCKDAASFDERAQEEGSADRLYLGIDGTMGDAQDVDHPFLASVHGAWCRVCGLAASYRRHKGSAA